MSQRKQWDHFFDFIASVPVDKESLDFFSRLPIVGPYLAESSPYQLIPFASRYDKSTTENKFFSQTINSPDTIPRALCLLRRDTLFLNPKFEESLQGPANPDIAVFVQVGPALNGFEDVAHGGIVASLLDETLSFCVEAWRCSFDLAAKRPAAQQTRLYTANINISYRAPATTPGIIGITAWLRWMDGRKWFLEARMTDQHGKVLAEAQTLYVSQKPGAVI
ncbi:hypothetical protein N7474_002974 [Penicillium riverlandense]|uniref:uncharacterized protein n=1 Tax=Penicillium riverlandense TaxID=1903569 RepID=UPI002546B13A|nr:uncharacterized protein N7474_002974 [Penicillium riverlandense]KAJ5825836.1 hypothetical protein N7474_002974 [Penicillium riverlandense]